MTKILNLHYEFCNERKIFRNFSDKTISWYKLSFDKFLDFHKGGITSVDQITTENLREFLYHGRIEKNWSVATFMNYHKGLSAFLNWSVGRNYIRENPIRKIEKPKAETRLPRRIPKQDAIRILEYARNMRCTYRYERTRNQAAFGLMIYAGLRANEMLSLKVADIDVENKTLHINRGKGAKDRVVPICNTLRIMLEEYVRERRRLGKDCVNFLTSAQHDQPFTYNGLKKVVDVIKKRTKIQFTPHTLRHTFATLMLEGGCDIFSLSKMMGHSDIKTTTIYLSASVSHLQEQIRKHPLDAFHSIP